MSPPPLEGPKVLFYQPSPLLSSVGCLSIPFVKWQPFYKVLHSPVMEEWKTQGSTIRQPAVINKGLLFLTWGSPHSSQLVKNPPAMWETWVWSLGWENPQEKGMANHSSMLAWRIPWTEEQFMGLQRVGHNWVINTFNFQHSFVTNPSVFSNNVVPLQR